MEILNIINNREISLLTCLVVFIAFCLSIKNIRSSLVQVFKTFFSGQLLFWHIGTGSYISFLAVLLAQIGFWRPWMLKDTILWALVSGLALLFRYAQTSQKEALNFKNVLIDNIKIIALFEFVVNLTSFNLWIEILLLPLILFVTLMSEVAKLNEKHRQVGKFFEWVQSAVGITILYFSIQEVVSNSKQYWTTETASSFMLPIVMTVGFLPFVVFAGLYSRYELVFVRINFWNEDPEQLRKIKWVILKKCRFNLNKLDKLLNPSNLNALKFKTIEEIESVVDKVAK